MTEPIYRGDALRPLPMRIPQRTYQRLVAHRAIDSITIQEHVRRALSEYLDNLDLKLLNQRLLDPSNPSLHPVAGPDPAGLERQAAVAGPPPVYPSSTAALISKPKPTPTKPAATKRKTSSTPGRARAKNAAKKVVYR